MKLYGPDKKELMAVSRFERNGSHLVIRAKVFGTLPVTATLTPAEVREGLRLLRWQGILFLLTMPFRRSGPKRGERA